jgi:hypothetical protein
MQYLLHSVGICCGQIVSETHSWNVVKLGKHCYHLDATWGDSSKTKDNTDNPLKDVVRYDYFCITTKENNAGGAERIPDPKIFRGLEEFRSTKHNYFHHEGAYLTKYDEDQLTQIFKNAIVSRDGVINIRCANKQLCTAVAGRLMKDGRATEIMKNAFAAMNDQQRKRFRNCSLDGRYYYDFKLNIIYILLKMK